MLFEPNLISQINFSFQFDKFNLNLKSMKRTMDIETNSHDTCIDCALLLMLPLSVGNRKPL